MDDIGEWERIRVFFKNIRIADFSAHRQERVETVEDRITSSTTFLVFAHHLSLILK